MLKQITIISALTLGLLQLSYAESRTLDVAKSRCLSHPDDTPELYVNEFKWGNDLKQLSEKFDEVYNSGKRIGRHAQYDTETQSFQLFLTQKNTLIPIRITSAFLNNVTRQIEIAIEKGYADYVMYSDMGHSHLFFPEDHWKAQYQSEEMETASEKEKREKMLADSKMRPLYHLTEQLTMVDKNKQPLDNGVLAHKYWHRNFWGTNDGSDLYETLVKEDKTKYNTVSHITGQFKYSAGFAVSASKNGCFPYKSKNGETLYFDISLYDPGQDPSAVMSGDYE